MSDLTDYTSSYLYKLYTEKDWVDMIQDRLGCSIHCLDPNKDKHSVMIYKYHKIGDNHNTWHFDANTYDTERITLLLCIKF